MVAISGGQTNAAIQIATTWGTAVASGAGDRFGATEYSFTPSVDVLQGRLIGSNQFMTDDFVRGNVTYTGTTTSDLGYRNGCDVNGTKLSRFPLVFKVFLQNCAGLVQ